MPVIHDIDGACVSNLHDVPFYNFFRKIFDSMAPGTGPSPSVWCRAVWREPQKLSMTAGAARWVWNRVLAETEVSRAIEKDTRIPAAMQISIHAKGCGRDRQHTR